MSDRVRALETFAWEHGIVHWHAEYPANAEVVARFPQFFETVGEAEPVAPKKVGRPRKAANG